VEKLTSKSYHEKVPLEGGGLKPIIFGQPGKFGVDGTGGVGAAMRLNQDARHIAHHLLHNPAIY
jgi:hypothetical protein